MRAAVVIASTILLLAACGGDDSASVATTDPVPQAEESVTVDAPEVEDGTPGPDTEGGVPDGRDPGTTDPGTTDPRTTDPRTTDPRDGEVVASADATRGEISYITDVRSAGHGGYDRVVFEYESEAPGYRVAWVAAPIMVDPSDRETKVDGNYFLEVRMAPASSVDLDRPGPNGYRETYAGPKRVRSDTSNVTEVVEGTDFEAEAIWIVGMGEPAGDVSVTVMPGPSRLVLDIS